MLVALVGEVARELFLAPAGQASHFPLGSTHVA